MINNHIICEIYLDISDYYHEGDNNDNSPRYPQRVRNDLRFRELTGYALSVLAPVFSALSLAARRGRFYIARL